jgi:hypothetical protein
MNGNDTFLDINNAHLRVNSGNVQASTFVLDQINIVTSANTNSTVNFNNVTKAFNAASNIEVGTANLFVDTTTSNVGIGTDAPLDTLHINGGTLIGGHILPTQHQQFDIGSAERKIRHLFLSDNSLWLGDETRITFSGGKMKFRRRKKNILPRGLRTIGIAAGHANEAATRTAALAHAGKTDITEMKLEHWVKYAKTLDATKDISDVFTEEADDYEATTASEAFKEIGDDIFSSHNVAIGKSTAPTSALDVVGTVKATAFEGDGSALTGITSGQWTESGGNISRSTGNVSVGEQSSEQTVTQNYNSLTNIPSSSRSQGNWRSHTFGNITLPANWSNDNFQFKVTVNGNLNGVANAEYISITMKKQGSGTQPSVGLNFNPQNQSSGISSSGGRVYYTNVVVTNSTVSNGSFSAGDVVDIYMSIYSTYWYQLSLAVEIRGGGTTSILFVDGTNDRVGIGLTQPTTALDVSGTVKATAFEGDGSALTGIVAGQWTESSGDIQRSSGNVGIGKAPDSGKKLDVNGTVKATAFEGDGSALTGISSGQWTYTAGSSSSTQQLVFDDQAPGTTFTGTLSGNSNNTAIRDTGNGYIRVTQGGTSRIGSVYWQTTLTNNWEATFEIYILPINWGGADDMRFIFYATNPITSNDGATGTNGHGGAYMRWEYYNSDYVELYDHTATAVVSSSASLQMNGWMPVTVTFNNGQLTSTIKNSSGTTLKTTTYDFGTTYSARYNTPTYVAVTGRSGGVQAEDRVRNITINALNVPTGHKLTRMNANVGIDVANPTQKLDVNGTVKATAFEGENATLSNFLNLGTHTSAPSNPVNGSLYYNTTTNSLELYKNGWASLSAFAPSDISGLVGWYLPQNWNGSTWVDASGSGNDTTSKVGTINYSATQSGGGATNSFPILYGDTSTKINFPSAICPSTYTLVYVTRYYSSQTGRILDSQSNNWLSGHWSGKSGLAYHGAWLTQTTSDIHGSNWVLGVDQNSLFRHKSANVGWSQHTGGAGYYPNLRLGSQGYEPSNWQCAEICVYNRHLSSTEYTKVADYMEKKFGI